MKRMDIILPLVLLAVAPMPSFCQTQDAAQTEGQDEAEKKQYLYKWEDEEGNIHVSTDLGKVPAKHRGKAERILQPSEKEAPPVYREQYPAPSEPGKNNEQELKAAWQERVKKAEERLAEAEKKYERLKTEREGLFRAWGAPAYAPLSVRERAVQIEEELTETQKEMNEARHELEEVIPEAARKAGIPPGWLRE